MRTDVPLTLLPLLAFAGILGACSDGSSKVKNAPGASAVEEKLNGDAPSKMTFEADGKLSLKLDLADGDKIIALGHSGDQKVSASSRTGKAWSIDLAAGTADEVPAFFKFDKATSIVATVSKDYVWVVETNKGKIGRNRLPASSSASVDISKVAVDDLISDMKVVQVLAADESHLFAVTDNSLLLFGYKDDNITRKKIGLLGGGLAKDEVALGAGVEPVEDGDDSIWLATNQRLLVFAGSWTEREMLLTHDGGAPSLAFLTFGDGVGTAPTATLGLFDKTLASLAKLAKKKKK